MLKIRVLGLKYWNRGTEMPHAEARQVQQHLTGFIYNSFSDGFATERERNTYTRELTVKCNML
jgi:hypothetical protein